MSSTGYCLITEFPPSIWTSRSVALPSASPLRPICGSIPVRVKQPLNFWRPRRGMNSCGRSRNTERKRLEAGGEGHSGSPRYGCTRNTSSLAKLISNTIPAPVRRRSKIHPATKTFQGVRIAINRELERIESALPKAFALLVPGGVLAAISFHSLEDRIVKRYFRHLCGQPLDRNDSTPAQMRSAVAEALTRKPITASEAEMAHNPRSRSAKLRAVRKQIGLN